jgi:hypothetical protein
MSFILRTIILFWEYLFTPSLIQTYNMIIRKYQIRQNPPSLCDIILKKLFNPTSIREEKKLQ